MHRKVFAPSSKNASRFGKQNNAEGKNQILAQARVKHLTQNDRSLAEAGAELESRAEAISLMAKEPNLIHNQCSFAALKWFWALTKQRTKNS